MQITSKRLEKLQSATRPSKDQHSAPQLVIQLVNYIGSLPKHKYLPHPTSQTYTFGFPLQNYTYKSQIQVEAVHNCHTNPSRMTLLSFFPLKFNLWFKKHRELKMEALWPSM